MIDEADMRAVKTLAHKVHTESVVWINLFFGAFVGIIGSLYHILGVRGYVMDNRDAFLRVEAALTNPSSDK